MLSTSSSSSLSVALDVQAPIVDALVVHAVIHPYAATLQFQAMNPAGRASEIRAWLADLSLQQRDCRAEAPSACPYATRPPRACERAIDSPGREEHIDIEARRRFRLREKHRNVESDAAGADNRDALALPAPTQEHVRVEEHARVINPFDAPAHADVTPVASATAS